MANLSDIARLAGGFSGYGFRVVNGTARVAPEKRERILKAMRETGFQPVESAKAFYKQPSSLIGYVIPSLHNLFLNEIGNRLGGGCPGEGLSGGSVRQPGSRKENGLYQASQRNERGWHCYHHQQRRDGGGNPPVPPACVVVDRKAYREYEASVSSDNYLGGQPRGGAFGDCGCKGWFTCGVLSFTAAGRCVFRGTWMCRKWNLEPRFLDCGYDFESGLACAPIFWNAFPIPMGFFLLQRYDRAFRI